MFGMWVAAIRLSRASNVGSVRALNSVVLIPYRCVMKLIFAVAPGRALGAVARPLVTHQVALSLAGLIVGLGLVRLVSV